MNENYELPRNYELARGVKIHKNPDKMTPTELLDALDNVAEFASRLLSEKLALERVMKSALHSNQKAD